MGGILPSPACGGLGSGGQKIWAVPNLKFQTAKEPENKLTLTVFWKGKRNFFIMKKITLKLIFIFGVFSFFIISIASAQTTLRYTQNLYFGIKDSSVTTLQTDLASDSSIYPEKLITGYFGALTQKAVQRFQAKYGIVNSGTPLTTGYGRVGPKTRAKLNELYGQHSSACMPGNPVSVTLTSPNNGGTYQAGTQLNISWESCNLSANSWIGLAANEAHVASKLPVTQNNYVWKIPIDSYCGAWGSDICYGQALSGSNFKVVVRIYEDQGTNSCLGFCPPGTTQPKLIASDESEVVFTITP